MNQQEFKQQFIPYHRMLFRVAFNLTGNTQDAEDLLQDTYLRIWQKRELLAQNGVNEAYLIIMMRHLHLDKIRQKTLDTSQQLKYANELSENDTPESRTEREDEAFLMKDLIAHLPPRERDIMTMYLLEELSYEEMETSTGIRQGNLRQIVTRTRKRLKEQFLKIARTWKD